MSIKVGVGGAFCDSFCSLSPQLTAHYRIPFSVGRLRPQLASQAQLLSSDLSIKVDSKSQKKVTLKRQPQSVYTYCRTTHCVCVYVLQQRLVRGRG